MIPMSRVAKFLPLCAWWLGAAVAIAAPSQPDGSWVGTWGAAPQLTEPKNLPPAPGLSDSTLRQIVHVSIGGSRLRVRFSNAFGSGPVEIAAAAVAMAGDRGAIQPDSSRSLSFEGRPAVTIAPGAMAVSDPVDYELAPLSDLAVTMHFGQVSRDVTGHPGARCTSYLQKGDFVSTATLPTPVTIEHWYILSGVEVWAEQPQGVLAILGDSITDGRGSTTDRNRRWPDDLARRLQADPRTARIGVLNQGIGGNRLLHDGLGPSALARLDRDVLEQNGVRWLIVFEGVNDIGTAPGDDQGTAARKVIGAYEEIIRRAHARNIRVYGATITPFGGSFYASPAREANWQAVNTWIRTSGRFDGVIDLAAAVCDPTDPTRLAPAVDCGDHLHLSDQGYVVVAGAIDLDWFTR
jgi:lysophospholipase L1-like esterase